MERIESLSKSGRKESDKCQVSVNRRYSVLVRSEIQNVQMNAVLVQFDSNQYSLHKLSIRSYNVQHR